MDTILQGQLIIVLVVYLLSYLGGLIMLAAIIRSAVRIGVANALADAGLVKQGSPMLLRQAANAAERQITPEQTRDRFFADELETAAHSQLGGQQDGS